jgi:acyl carrier protein
MNNADYSGPEDVIRAFILAEFLPGEDPGALTSTTPLITTGVLDSIATIKLVAFLEERFGISIGAHEAGVEHLNTIDAMVVLIAAKKSRGAS